MASKYPITLAYVKRYGDQVEQEIEKRLYNYGKYATGKLYDSIRYEIKETKSKISIAFFMLEYGKFVDKGTKPSKYADSKGKGTGKSPFIESLMKWCVIKGIPKEAAFPIRRNIWKYGIAPTNFFTIPTTRRVASFAKGVGETMAKDYEKMIKKEYDGNKSNKRT